MSGVRVAFVTPEHPATSSYEGGGLASYLLRMTAALRAVGCEVEVFTTGEHARVVEHEGVRIEVCPPASNGLLRLLGAHWRGRVALGGTLTQLRASLGLARALARRERTAKFDLVQSSDWGLTGYFVKSAAHRTHVQRCSWSRELCRVASGQNITLDFRALCYLDRVCARRADVAYAPSRFIAAELAQRYGTQVRVIRPPMAISDPPSSAPARDVAGERVAGGADYLLHFGLMSPLKGTDLAVAAFERAQREEPTMRMMLVGREHRTGYVEELLESMSSGADQVLWRGPIIHAEMPSIIGKARAAVLPSRADNLPNTVIESLSAGVPVIGTDGASIDELVTHEATGMLVPMNNVEALADAMVRTWRQPWHINPSDLARHPTWQAMTPDIAVSNLLDLADIKQTPMRLAA